MMMAPCFGQSQVLPSMCGSLFPDIAEMLEESDYQKALTFVASRKNMEAYHDNVDFLFCELFKKFRSPCRRFYEGNGPPLHDLPEATPDQIRRWQVFMKGALLVAHAAMEQQRRMSWSQFQGVLAELSRATPTDKK